MTELLTTIAIIFIAAGPFLLLANALRLPTAPALIVAGVIAGFFIDETLKLEIARLGIALLVFTFAARVQMTDLQPTTADSEVVAFTQLAILGSAGFAAGVLIGLSPGQSIFLGMAAAISSSILGSTLFLAGDLELIHDRLSESIHSIQDFAALFLLLVVSAGVFELDPIATQLGYGVILLLAAVAIHRYFFDLLGHFAGRSSEAMLIGTVALLLAFLSVAEYIGLSIVVGAFAAGIAVVHDRERYSGMINGLDSINAFFAAIFFITVGALVEVPGPDTVAMTVILVGLVAVVKPAITIALLIYRGYERRTATLTGFNLDQVGEFALVIAIEALFLGLLLPSVFEAIVLAVALTLITSSFTRYYDEEIYHTLANAGVLGRHGATMNRWSTVPADLTDHIILVGYGRHSRLLVEVCEQHDQPYVVVESNPALLDHMHERCQAFVYGDVIEPDTLEKARVYEARLLLSTADTQPVNEFLMDYTDQVDVIVRTKDRASAKRYLRRGAFYVSVSDLLAADRLEGRFERLIAGEYDTEALREEVLGSLPPHREPPRSVRWP